MGEGIGRGGLSIVFGEFQEENFTVLQVQTHVIAASVTQVYMIISVYCSEHYTRPYMVTVSMNGMLFLAIDACSLQSV